MRCVPRAGWWFVLFMMACGTAETFAPQPAHGSPPTSRHKVGLRNPQDQLVALTGLTIITAPGEQIENGTILIRDQKIAAIGAGLTIPAGAEVIDLSGKFAYPGLIDGFTSSSFDFPDTLSDHGYWNNQIRSQLRAAAGLKSEKETHATLRKQGVVARLLAPSSGVIRGVSTLLQTTKDFGPEQTILNSDVAMHGRLTVDRRTTSRESYPNSPMGAVALARQAMYDARWYQQAWAAYTADTQLPIPERNLALEALQPVLAGKMPLMLETLNEIYSLRADRFAKEFGVRLILLGSGNEYRRLEEIAALNCPIVVPVNFPDAPNVSTPELASVVSLESLMHWDHAPENPARLARAGVSILLTSDGLKDRKDFLKQVRLAVERGLPESDALKALTVTPAQLYGVAAELGTLEPGKLASFVVTDGKLFEKKTKLLETWVAGERDLLTQKSGEDVAGVWTLTVTGLDEQGPEKLVLEVKNTDKLTAKIRQADASDSVSLKSVDETSGIFTGQFESKTFGGDGLARLSLVINPTEPEKSLGTLLWPSGASARVAAAPSTEAFLPDQKPEDTSDSKSREDDDKDNDKDRPALPASFPVNYPLGDYGLEAPPKPAGLTAFTNVTLWTSGPDGIIEKGTLLIDNGKILAVGASVNIPAGATVIDLTGKAISPGLIDCHSHIATDGGINESSQAVTAEVRIGDCIDSDDINIYRQLAGGVTSSNILHGSANPIGGQNQVLKFRWGLNDAEMKFAQAPPGIKFALGENVKQSNWGDRYTTRYPQTRMGVEQIMIDEFEAAKYYAAEWARWNESKTGLPPRVDLELETIVEILNKKRWIHCHSYRQDEIVALLRTLERYNIQIGTLQHILEGYKVADVLRAHGAMASCFTDWWSYKLEVVDAIPYDGAMMHRLGIVVSFNSDDGELGRHLNQEAAKAVKYGGVPPAEALKFVTINPAKQLRIDQYVGSLEPGKDADFIIWSGSPLSNFSHVLQSWIDGTLYFDRARDEELRQLHGQQRWALIQKVLSSKARMRSAGEDDGDESIYWPRYDEFCHHSSQGHTHSTQNKQ